MNILPYFEKGIDRSNGGKSWWNWPKDLQCSCFYRDNPDRYNRILGFRVFGGVR
jgi:formylglycine-generating enzyme required for sulfatase activity